MVSTDPEIEEVRRARLERLPYWLVFTALDAEIFILAVAHVRRDPGYWRGRVARGP